MKIIAWHLPQFHEIEENNKWWGKGFTEWTNVKKAKPLFKGHSQPNEPLKENYYNMLEKDTMIWQAKTAKDYGVYGFCYYHYYFGGKKLLEKPIENLLKWTDIDFPFCLSWANEPWTRAWDGKDKEVLMSQVYGEEREWEEHFNYLLNFFNDKRYIKIDNKPIFLIYRTENIPKCEKMIELWNKLAKENGFNGVYIVETLNSFQNKSNCLNSEAEVYMEPMYTFRYSMNKLDKIVRKIKKWKLVVWDYDKIWKKIIKRKYNKNNKEIFLGGFVDWDSTPRKGEKGIVFSNVSTNKFEFYLEQQIKRANELNSKFIFINAWNEWAEGTYLEPDKKNKYGYLEAVKKCLKKIEQ